MTWDEPIDLGAVRRAREEFSKLVKAHPELNEAEAQERLAELLDDESALGRAELSAVFDKLRALDNQGGLEPALSDNDRINFALKLNALVSVPQKELPNGKDED
ncbi:MAG: hypothetical protein GY813_13400 [Halieaceae bacterium]|nr:hypothetical protein [Halieaceae bacterium]